jgi:hypothetical protein
MANPKINQVQMTGQIYGRGEEFTAVNLLTLELNPSAQRCLTKFCFTGDFAS